MSGRLRIRRMAETDTEVVATLAGELGYPSELESIRERIRAISGADLDLLLVAVDATDRPIGFIQAHRSPPFLSGLGLHEYKDTSGVCKGGTVAPPLQLSVSR